MTTQFRHVLVPLDMGDGTLKVLDAAIDVAKHFGAALTLVHAYEIPAYVYGGVTYTPTDLFGPIADAARVHLDEALKRAKQSLPAATAVLRRGPAAGEILSVIDEVRPDLVVMGTHGRKGMSHLLLGSVAEKVVRLSPVPVLTFREREKG
jgi:nucleotide-binding universal stress UspA family protein